MIGRTLEETSALFDGEKPQQDLAQLGGQGVGRAAIPMTQGSNEKPNSHDLTGDDWMELTSTHSFPSQSFYKQADSSSRRQSQESELGV